MAGFKIVNDASNQTKANLWRFVQISDREVIAVVAQSTEASSTSLTWPPFRRASTCAGPAPLPQTIKKQGELWEKKPNSYDERFSLVDVGLAMATDWPMAVTRSSFSAFVFQVIFSQFSCCLFPLVLLGYERICLYDFWVRTKVVRYNLRGSVRYTTYYLYRDYRKVH